MEQAIISGVAHDRSEAKITVVGVPDKVGEAAAIFGTLADAADQHRHDRPERLGRRRRTLTDISFTLPRADGQTAMTALAKAQGRDRVRAAAVRRRDRQGVDHRRRHALGTGHHGQVLRALADAGVNIEMISTSEIRISVVVAENQVDAAVNAAHDAFDLDTDEVEAVVYGGTGR